MLATLDTASIDAIVTDPPYGLAFMGKKWDYDVPGVDAFREMYRVLTPGGRLLCFAGTRTMHRMWVNIEDAGFTIEDSIAWLYGSGFPKHRSKLKPAYEPVCVARKGGVSPLNIDAARITTSEKLSGGAHSNSGRVSTFFAGLSTKAQYVQTEGRWPANVILDEEAAAALNEQSGESTSSEPRARTGTRLRTSGFRLTDGGGGYSDTGGASRFFYVAKASRSEREAGIREAGIRQTRIRETMGDYPSDPGKGKAFGVGNHHPTVKPVALMRHLVRLVTAQGGTVLDPFTGSGSTGVAAVLEGRSFLGIELDAQYARIARARIGYAKKQARPRPRRKAAA